MQYMTLADELGLAELAELAEAPTTLPPTTLPAPSAPGRVLLRHRRAVDAVEEARVQAFKRLQAALSDTSAEAATAQASQVSTETELINATGLQTSLDLESAAAEQMVTVAESGELIAADAEIAAELAAEVAGGEMVALTEELAVAVAAGGVADAAEATTWWTGIGAVIAGLGIVASIAAIALLRKKLAGASAKKKQAADDAAKANNAKRTKASEKAHAKKKVDDIVAHKGKLQKRIQDLQGKIDATKAQEAVLKDSFTSIKAAMQMLEHHTAVSGSGSGSVSVSAFPETELDELFAREETKAKGDGAVSKHETVKFLQETPEGLWYVWRRE